VIPSARTFAYRAGTRADAGWRQRGPNMRGGSGEQHGPNARGVVRVVGKVNRREIIKRSHECERGMQECVRHIGACGRHVV